MNRNFARDIDHASQREPQGASTILAQPRYVCALHPEISGAASRTCPHCGEELMPAHRALAQAAAALHALVLMTSALRRHPI